MTPSIFDVPCVALTTLGLVLRSVPAVPETAVVPLLGAVPVLRLLIEWSLARIQPGEPLVAAPEGLKADFDQDGWRH
jgi:hypothetical protein